ncbi:MAG: porin [Planctomycetota bacterium]
MRAKYVGTLAALFVVATFTGRVFAGSAESELQELRGEVQKLRELVNANRAAANASVQSNVDTMMDSKYGPDAAATTRIGKLEIGGLVQVWYTYIQNDSRGLFDSPNNTGVFDTNAASDNDSFRIRRAEIRMKMDIHENVSAFVKIDPAAEAASFPQLGVGAKRLAYVSPEFNAINTGPNPPPGGTIGVVKSVQEGSGLIPTLLQDAIINFHGVIPHHDFTLGQMSTTFNEENFQDNGMLDFAERSYIANLNSRDIGSVIHGSWWCNGGGGVYQGAGDSGRLQYWLGMYNSAGNLHGTAGSGLNRSDDNDKKDFIATLLVRPLWDDCWGHLEVGASVRTGTHGKDGNGHPITIPSNGLDRQKTSAMGYDGWMKYYAPGVLKGLWLKGEAQWLHDRNAPQSIIDVANNDFQNGGDQAHPYSTFGYWGAIGYKFADSPLFCNCTNSFWRNFEVLGRYESAPSVTIADPIYVEATNVYQQKIYTAGVNYYIKGNNAKIQMNYNAVKNPHGPNGQPFHNVRNDSLILNFQVMW